MSRIITRRDFLAVAGLSAAAATSSVALAACSAQPSSSKATSALSSELLAIIHTNDTHGYDVETAATGGTPGNFSMAAVAQLAEDYRNKGYQVILVDSGDAIQDTPLVDQSKGSTAIDFMNACDYQVMALGNHEFDWGADNLRQLRDKARFPFVSANVIDSSTKAPVFDANATVTLDDGFKVGFFGLTTPATATAVNPSKISGLSFLAGDDLVKCAQAQADKLRHDGCSLIVCLGHLGGAGSVSPNRSYDLLEKVTGVDVFIDGHDHEVENSMVGGTLLVETGCHLNNIGVITFEEGVVTENLVAFGTYSGKDAGVESVIQGANDDVSAALSYAVGTTTHALDGSRDPGVRTQETNLGDLVADAYLWEGKSIDPACDAALLNGGSIRASIDAGDISLKTVKAVLPYDGQVEMTTLTGAQLLEAIEAATFMTPTATGSFPQVAGMTYTVDTSVAYEQGSQYQNSTYCAPARPGSRVTISDVGGKGFSADASYRVVSTDFVMQGGDTYHVFKEASDANGTTSGDFDYEAVVSFVEEELGGVVGDDYAFAKGRITIL